MVSLLQLVKGAVVFAIPITLDSGYAIEIKAGRVLICIY
jgi:hypothetical protein